ncbi:lysozyme-like protein [Rhizobium phage RHph_N17]|nr:lysozyme-like protein [Rhizobium phage RHph_N17]
MDRKAFFDNIRKTIFNGSLTTSQVKGIDALLDACALEQVADGRHVAYVLATPMIETGGTYLTKQESLNYSPEGLRGTFGIARISAGQAQALGRTPKHAADQQAIANIVYGGNWGKENLGNVRANDGWDFRGRGLCQITGRANYEKFAKLLGLPLDTNPDLAMQVDIAAKIMVVGMRDGLFTGRKLGNYFTPVKSDWVNARQIINRFDRAEDIANYGRKFFSCISSS